MSNITTIAGLFELLRQGRMSPEELVQWLSRRGAVPQAIHKAELQRLDEALNSKLIDAQLHRALGAKLRDLQSTARPAASATGVLQKEPVPPALVTAVNLTAGNPRGTPGEIPDRISSRDRDTAADDDTTANPAPVPNDRTLVNPATPSAQAGFDLLLTDAPDSEATLVNPESASDTTAFTPTVARGRPSEPVTGTGTSTSGPPSASSWERMAANADVLPEPSVYPGMMLKERFYLEKEVGRGGMGVVYKARDERKVEAQDKNPWVAVKILNDEFRHHPQSLIALQREARKAQQLTHDNILRVYDFDKAGAIVYITMEYADGGTVKEYIKKGAAKGGWTYAEGRKVIEGMAHGLARAHRDGIVHSDFKPGNVMVGENSVPKVFDLGIARAAKTGDQKSGEVTVFDAATLGALTPAYASLEMMRGEDPQIPDDVYALAITTYEVLTGRHPYAKKNAEQAMKEGLKPQRIPGLTRQQWRTLEKGLAFERKNRLQTADALIEGMRPRTFKDYALPVSVATAGAVLLLGGVFGLLLPKLQGVRVDRMVEKFEQAAFADHTAALQELAAMSEKDRAEVKQRHSAVVQDYFFRLANDKWDLKAQRYGHANALAILQAVNALYPDSKSVAENLARIEQEKNDKLSALNDEISTRLAAQKIYEDQKDNVVETFSVVRRIDPKSALLKNSGLLAAYTRTVRQSFDAGDLAAAEKRVASALKVFPAEPSLLTLQADVKTTLENQLAMQRRREQAAQYAQMAPAQVRAELEKLASRPLFTPDWQVQVAAAVAALERDTSVETARLKETLAEAFAGHIAAETAGERYGAAQMVADRGVQLFPGAQGLRLEKSKLDQARKAAERAQLAMAAAGEIESLKNTVAARATANDVRGAEAAFNDLKRRLPANDPYLSGDGPKALGEAFLRQADLFAKQQRYADAQQRAAAGLRIAPTLEALKVAEKNYGLEARVATLENGARNPASANGEQLRAALAALKTEDPQRHDKVIGDLLGTAVKSIEALTSSDRASARRGKAEWLKVFPQDTKLAALVIPEGGVSESLPAEARRARRARGEDTCDKGFATYGANSRATCFDDVAGAPGPRLVVVPGVGGGTPFAISKYEITVKQFNAFCSASGKCAVSGAADTLPRTNISFALAKDYAAWLTETTGFTYRLPTDAEWTHAAGAQGKGAGEEFNCVLMQGDQQIKGGAAIAVNVGRPNPWGLINAVGNAAEWVEGAAVRGGNFNVPMTRCTVEWRESGSGAADTIGLRLVREIG